MPAFTRENSSLSQRFQGALYTPSVSGVTNAMTKCAIPIRVPQGATVRATTQTLSCDWPRAVLASTISNLRKRTVGNVKRDTLSTRSERPQGPLTDIEQSEFYLREGERLAHMGSWSLRPEGTFDYWSPETFVIFGFDPGNGIPTLKEWLSVLRLVDADRVHALIQKMFLEGVKGDILYRVDHPEHGQRTMHSTG